MAGINAERDMWKHLTEVMDRLNKVEQEAKKQHIILLCEYRFLC